MCGGPNAVFMHWMILRAVWLGCTYYEGFLLAVFYVGSMPHVEPNVGFELMTLRSDT